MVEKSTDARSNSAFFISSYNSQSRPLTWGRPFEIVLSASHKALIAIREYLAYAESFHRVSQCASMERLIRFL
jgi:hypothetical protein